MSLVTGNRVLWATKSSFSEVWAYSATGRKRRYSSSQPLHPAFIIIIPTYLTISRVLKQRVLLTLDQCMQKSSYTSWPRPTSFSADATMGPLIQPIAWVWERLLLWLRGRYGQCHVLSTCKQPGRSTGWLSDTCSLCSDSGLLLPV